MTAAARHDPTARARPERNLAARYGGSAIGMLAGRPATVRIQVTHACPLLRIGMATILAAQPGFDVVEGGFPLGPAGQHCVVVTDYSAGMQAMRQRGSSSRVLIVTSRDKAWDVRQALDSGVDGYLLQNCVPDELITSVHLLSRGTGYLSPTLKRSVASAAGQAALTGREHDVLRLLARGDSDKVIARELGIGVVTVKTHVVHVLQKLNATARTHAVVVALQRGLLQDGPVPA